jgi:hypothetical protein
LNHRWSSFVLLSFALSFFPPVFQDGTVSMNMRGTCPQDPQRLAQAKKKAKSPTPGMGTQEIQRPDGGKDTIYYSTTTPEEEKKTEQEEKEKVDKSLNMLPNIIIDDRRTR